MLVKTTIHYVDSMLDITHTWYVTVFCILVQFLPTNG
jgi:hypothetical protein